MVTITASRVAQLLEETPAPGVAARFRARVDEFDSESKRVSVVPAEQLLTTYDRRLHRALEKPTLHTDGLAAFVETLAGLAGNVGLVGFTARGSTWIVVLVADASHVLALTSVSKDADQP